MDGWLCDVPSIFGFSGSRMKISLMVLVMVIFSHIFDPVSSLQCHVCISSLSWKDCAESQDPLTCASVGDQYCYYHSIQTNVGGYKMKAFAKGCASSDKCSPAAITSCKNTQIQHQQMGINSVKCYLDCCQGDLCN